jgi:putative ABC transport system permease protein
MTFADAFRLALRNLGQAKLRTSLTSMGVAIGIASLAGMVSLGVGLQDQVVGSFMRSGLFDSITVASNFGAPGAVARMGRGGGQFGRERGRGRNAGAPDARPLDDVALKELAQVPQVTHVYPNLRVPMQITLDQDPQFVAVAGVPMFANGQGAFQSFAAGGFFTSDTGSECVITTDTARRLTNREPRDIVGQQLTASYAAAGGAGAVPGSPLQLQRVDAKYTIVGIVDRDPSPLGGGGLGGQSGIMIPLGKAIEINAAQITNTQAMLRDGSAARTYQTVTVNVSRASAAEDVEAKIKDLGFQAFSLNDALQGAKRAFILLDIFLSMIGSIALAVSSLGIINTMVMSILERTREIGIMKAIGGSDGDIRRIFLIEASSIGLIGGVVGIAIGWLVGRVINIAANYYIVSQGGATGNFFSLPFWLIGGALGFSVVISLLAGSYPASRAARLDPIQALRHD